MFFFYRFVPITFEHVQTRFIQIPRNMSGSAEVKEICVEMPISLFGVKQDHGVISSPSSDIRVIESTNQIKSN